MTLCGNILEVYRINNRSDLTATTGSTSYLPAYNRMYVNVKMQLEDPWQLGRGLSHRASRYNNADAATDRSSRITRNDARRVGRRTLSHGLGRNLKMLAE